PTEIYTLSLHDALPIYWPCGCRIKSVRIELGLQAISYLMLNCQGFEKENSPENQARSTFSASTASNSHRQIRLGWQARSCSHPEDRKSTRLNSSHVAIS